MNCFLLWQSSVRPCCVSEVVSQNSGVKMVQKRVAITLCVCIMIRNVGRVIGYPGNFIFVLSAIVFEIQYLDTTSKCQARVLRNPYLCLLTMDYLLTFRFLPDITVNILPFVLSKQEVLTVGYHDGLYTVFLSRSIPCWDIIVRALIKLKAGITFRLPAKNSWHTI